MAQGISRVPRPLHGRHRLVHAGALALHRRARELVAGLARRPAARRGRAHCMEKRRSAVLFLSVALIPAAQACTPAIDGPRLESKSYVLAYRASPEVGKHFTVEIAACAKSGPPPKTLKIDAQMPEHRHGMNYKPTVR